MSPGARRLKVLLTAQPRIGGAATHVRQLATGLDPEAFEVVVACPSGPLQGHLRKAGYQVEKIDFSKQINPISDARSLFGLRQLLRERAFDIVHSHSSKAGFLSRLAAFLENIPVSVYTPHGFAFYQAQGPTRLLYLGLERLAANFGEAIICVSESELEAAKHDRIAPANKLHLIRNGIDLSELPPSDPATLRQMLKSKPDTLLVGMVSRLKAPKRPFDIIHAAERIIKDQGHTDLAFVFVGGGPLEAKCRDLVTRLEIDPFFHFLGPRDNAIELIAGMDIFVLASDSEGLPYTLLEAMAYRKPAIGTNAKGIIDLIEDGVTGLSYAPGDTEALAKNLIRLLRKPALRRKLGEAGRQLVADQYSAHRMIEETERLYQRLWREQMKKTKGS